MKDINVKVGAVWISVTGGAFSMNAGSYPAGNISAQMTPELKTAMITFASLLIETEEE